MKKRFPKLLVALISLCFFAIPFVYGQTATPTPTTSDAPNSSEIRKKIADLEKKVSDLKSQADSLSSQIGVFDSQIKLAEFRIEATKRQVSDLTLDIDSATKRVKNLEGSLSNVSKVLINRIITTYEVGGIEPIHVLAASSDISDLVKRANYLKLVQEHDKRLMYNAQQARNDYTNQKNIFEDKKKKIEALKSQLEDYNKELDVQKDSKKKLLSETEGDEANYQKLLQQAKAQLTGFSNFTASQGGASLLSGQTVCDDWGCYYNQRDSQWGGNSLNGTQYTLASDGCLVTSMAMVYTHFGHRGVTPQTINSNPGNFASYFPAYLKYTITADGATASRVGSQIDSELSAGRPVVVGISYDGGPSPDHFLVLISGSGGNYQMNDPFTPNGHNIPFDSKYSVGSIKDVYRVSGL